MSSVGQAVGGIIGAVVGFITGGPAGAWAGAMRGFSIGATIGGMLDPPKGPNQTGPRLTDLSTQTSTYGTAIPRVYGTIATMGNIFWLQGDKLTEVATVSKQKSGGKGGGGKSTVTTYSYYATFAVGLCQGPIAGVRRIWIGANLIYDAGSDDLYSILASNAAASGFKIYAGSETQTADPRMQADKGVANVPAYRGLAYIVFYDFALKDYGNSLLGAQVKVEVVKKLTADTFSLKINVPDTGVTFARSGAIGAGIPYIKSTDGVVIVGVCDSTAEYVFSLAGDLITKRVASQPPIKTSSNPYTCVGRISTGYVEVIAGAVPGQTLAALKTDATGRIDSNLPAGRPLLCTALANDGQSIFVLSGNVGGNPAAENTDCVWTIIDVFGAAHRSGTASGGFSNQMGFCRGSASFFNVCFDQDSNTVVTIQGATSRLMTFHSINDAGVFSQTHSVGPILNYASFPYPSVYFSDGIAFCVSHSAFGAVYIGAITEGTTTLAEIISAECDLTGLIAPADIDVTAITPNVRGYRIAETGAIRAALEPLQGAFPFDVVQHGYKVTFLPRGGVSVKTIDEAMLDARAAGAAPGVALTTSREMDSQLPRRVSIKYFDVTREYDISEQYAERLNTDAVNVLDSTLPIVLTATEAAGVAEKLLYLYWLERYNLNFTLPPEYLDLEPGDVITLTGDFGSYEIRLTEINYTSGGWLECKGRLNNSAVYTAAAIGEEGSSVGKPIAFGGLSYYQLLDIPCLQDIFDAPGFPAAMCGYTESWPGGVIFRSNDGGQTWTDLQGFVGAVPIGFSVDILDAGRTDIIDAANTLTVSLLAGELVSVTQSQLFNGANYFAIGAHGRWEIVAAQNCVLQLDGSYILSDFLRGRFGTEWAMTTHAVGDAVVLLTDADMAWIGIDTASIGLERQYRGITNGAAIDTDASLNFTYSGVNLECLSPVYLNGSRHPATNDWTLTWIRRSRIDGALRNYVDVALGETTESYEIDIYADGTYATVKRTLTASTATVAYTSAQQTTDFGGNQTTLYVKVYQLSATVGRGYPLTATITR